MSPYILFGILLGVGVLQTAVMPHFVLWGVMPDLMLLVVVSWSLLRGSRESVVWALVGGLLLDLLSGAPFGAITIGLVVASLVASAGKVALADESMWLPLAASALATIIYDVTYLIALVVFANDPIARWASLPAILGPSIVVNGLAMYPIHWMMTRLHQHTSSEPVGW